MKKIILWFKHLFNKPCLHKTFQQLEYGDVIYAVKENFEYKCRVIKNEYNFVLFYDYIDDQFYYLNIKNCKDNTETLFENKMLRTYENSSLSH